MKKKLFTFIISLTFIGAYAQVPYSQDFEGSVFPPTGCQTFPIGSLTNWVRDTTASGYGTGTACTSFNNFNTAAGSYYGVRLPAMNFSAVSQPYIRFDIAYAMRTGTASDIFGFWWSNNGSSNWLNLHNYSSGTLTTAPATSTLFVPTPNQWQTKTLSIASLAGKPYVRLAIEDDCYHGNKIYLDNIVVFDSATVGVKEIYNSSQLQVYPDPFTSTLTIVSNPGQKILKAELYNSTGALAATITNENSIFTFENLSGLSEGIYLLKIYSEEGRVVTKKIMKR